MTPKAAVDAAVLAGGGREGGLPEGVPNKAFLPVAGKPLVQRVLEAVRASQRVRRMVLVVPAAPPEEVTRLADWVLQDRGDLLANVEAATRALDQAEWVLACAADLPLLTGKAVDSFLQACESREADFYYGIVRREDLEARYPGARKTFVRVREGFFTGSSLVLFRPAVLERVRPLLQQAVEARKNPARLASLFGGGYVVKYLTGRLTVADVERRARELTGLRGAAVVCPDPEVALDVDADKPQNLQVAEQVLLRA
ncbi:MAG: nucleotidyltransferase family protein [Armatimonadota bacterium]|nr:nucleotidyltransferase family protein [Armatimonadota bacterium]MDW8156374.1 nucleotidyltransferase family protein [Armatimonadota bacterium]